MYLPGWLKLPNRGLSDGYSARNGHHGATEGKMARIFIFASLAESLIDFRGPLLAAMVALGHKVTACAPNENPETSRRLHDIGVSFVQLEFQRAGLNPFADLRLLAKLHVLLRKERPDIMLSYTVKPVIYGSLAAAMARIPSIYSIITGLGYLFSGNGTRQRLMRKLIGWLYRLALASNKAVFFQNPDDMYLFHERRFVAGKTRAVLINGSGVDMEFFPMTPSVATPLVFLLLARLIRDKGIVEFAEAARKLKARYPHVRFWLLGSYDSNPTALSRDQVAQWQAEGALEYLGETKDVRPFIAKASVYVLPSYYREGVPRSVLEAMAMGRPIITTDAPGCRETVVPGVNGFLVPPRDVKALASTMEKFILEPGLIPSMGRASRDMAIRRFDVHKVNAVILRTLGLTDSSTGVQRVPDSRRFRHNKIV